jgi:hypothetical protein
MFILLPFPEKGDSSMEGLERPLGVRQGQRASARVSLISVEELRYNIKFGRPRAGRRRVDMQGIRRQNVKPHSYFI